MAGVFIARTPTFFFVLSPSIESFVSRQLDCKSPFYGYHEYPLEPSSLMSCCRTCTTLLARAARMQYSCRSRTVCDVESMDFNTTFDGRKGDHTTRIPHCCKTPLERTLGELPCLCSAQNPNMLVSLSVSRGVQAIAALSDRRAQTAMATETIEKRLASEQLMGALLRDYASEEGERSAEHNLKRS